MTEHLYAFLDECGEEGFSDRASEWFILSAALQDAERYTPVVMRHEEFRENHGYNDDWGFHFVKLSHRKRIAFIRHMADEPYTFMSVAIHKPSIGLTDSFKKPYYLYFYAAKLLLERVSWHCREKKRRLDHIYFSSRRGLREDHAKAYLRRLKRDEWGLSNSIHWPSFNDVGISVQPNKTKIGLQMADAMASSVGQALEPEFGVTESRYILEMKDQVFQRRGTRMSYGLKVFPRITAAMREEERFDWLEEFER